MLKPHFPLMSRFGAILSQRGKFNSFHSWSLSPQLNPSFLHTWRSGRRCFFKKQSKSKANFPFRSILWRLRNLSMFRCSFRSISITLNIITQVKFRFLISRDHASSPIIGLDSFFPIRQKLHISLTLYTSVRPRVRFIPIVSD